jgi:hypothetical protein
MIAGYCRLSAINGINGGACKIVFGKYLYKKVFDHCNYAI